MIKQTLTGRQGMRIYKPLFGEAILIVQVEIHQKGWDCIDSYGTGIEVDNIYWRDAKLTDFAMAAR